MEGAMLWVAVVLLGLILLSLWLVLYQLVKQQGRLLLRLDRVEHRLANPGHVGFVPSSAVNHAHEPRLNGNHAPPQGLPVGTAAPPFRLPDLTGRMVSLEDFRGKRVLLVHWSTQCGFCDMIAPELARLEASLRERNAQLVLISYGDAEANRRMAEEHGFDCPVLLRDQSEPLEVFENRGTPVAYLIDEEGRIAKPLASGADQVPELAREAATGRKRLPGERSLGESRIEREGLRPGNPAPLFSLPDIHGRTVALEQYRGRRVLLVFSDPHCGPCDQLAPHLTRLHREHRDNGMAFVMVGRGETEENRRKAEQHGIEFPVVLQEKWKLSKEYGIFATPVAFLISEEGVVARQVARGADEILALAQAGLVPGEETSDERAFR